MKAKRSKFNVENLESCVPFFARSTARDESEKTNGLKGKGKGGSKNIEIWLRKFILSSLREVSVLRSWSKVKLHRVVLLGFGLKELKIAPNIVKFGVHSYLLNVHLDL